MVFIEENFEDGRGITRADVCAITIERQDADWLVTIEQGNGAVIKQISLTDMERMQLGMMLYSEPIVTACRFLDMFRGATGGAVPG